MMKKNKASWMRPSLILASRQRGRQNPTNLEILLIRLPQNLHHNRLNFWVATCDFVTIVSFVYLPRQSGHLRTRWMPQYIPVSPPLPRVFASTDAITGSIFLASWVSSIGKTNSHRLRKYFYLLPAINRPGRAGRFGPRLGIVSMSLPIWSLGVSYHCTSRSNRFN